MHQTMRQLALTRSAEFRFFREYFTFPKLRGLSGLNLREIPTGSTGVLCPPHAKFLSIPGDSKCLGGTFVFLSPFWLSRPRIGDDYESANIIRRVGRTTLAPGL